MAVVARDVFLYIPNLIGYCRIVLTLLALLIGANFPHLWHTVLALYSVGQLLDAVDGWVARKYNQATQFGAILDQVTDRASTLGLLILCAIRSSPIVASVCILAAVIDIAGHWVHFFSSMLCGVTSHKSVPAGWPVLKFYYENRVVMFLAHGANEVFWLLLFAQSCIDLKRESGLATLFAVGFYTALPLCVFKNWTNLLQMLLGATNLASEDAKKRN